MAIVHTWEEIQGLINRVEALECWSPDSLIKTNLNLNERVRTLEAERYDEGNERRETEASLLNQIETRRCETNELKKRVGELENWFEALKVWWPKAEKPKPHTCGECEHTWEYTGCSPKAVSIISCRKNPKFDWEFHAVKKSHEDCNEFRQRGRA